MRLARRLLGRLVEVPAGRELLATVVISIVVTAVGCAIVSVSAAARTEHRATQTEQALCRVLDLSARPRPRPPVPPAAQEPVTQFGRDLAAYNAQIAKIQAEADAALRQVREDYRCRSASTPPTGGGGVE